MTNYKHYKLILGYFIIVVVSFYTAHYIVFGFVENLLDIYTGASFFTISIYMFALSSLNERNPLSSSFFVKLILALLYAGTLSSGLSYYLKVWRFAPRILLFSSILILIFVYLYRIALYLFSSRHIENIIIIGTGKAATLLGKEIEKYPNLYSLKGYIDYEKSTYQDIAPEKVYRDINKVPKILEDNKIDLIILANDLESEDKLLKIVVDMKLSGYNVVFMASFYELITGKVPVKFINNNWFIASHFHAVFNRFYVNFKRATDIFMASIGLILSSPIMIITALIIKLQDGGSVFFLQDRVGVQGKIFKIFKFRSMSVGSEKGNKYTQDNDPRITKIGSFIRKTRIDELPQFFNVLTGDMSMIGPRAEWNKLVSEYEKKIPYYSIRHVVKPGITGWAQVEYKYGASVDDTFEKLQYDLYYIKHQSLVLDITIVLKTIKVILSLGGK